MAPSVLSRAPVPVVPGLEVSFSQPSDCFILRDDDSLPGGKLISFQTRLYRLPKEEDLQSSKPELRKIFRYWTDPLKKICSSDAPMGEPAVILDQPKWPKVRMSLSHLRSLAVEEIIRSGNQAATAAHLHRFVESNPLPVAMATDIRRGIVWWVRRELEEVFELREQYAMTAEEVLRFIHRLEAQPTRSLEKAIGGPFQSAHEALMRLVESKDHQPEMDIKETPAIYYVLQAALLLK